jgi:polyisoprenyl-phosphate glycosyltransferase
VARIFSIVVPVFQNEANLADTVPKLLSLQEYLPNYILEIVFVDDGSSDGSFEILRHFASDHPQTIVVVKLSKNFGQTPAIQAGLCYASGDCVGIISADLQEPWELFVDMLKAWERGAKFVIGERQERQEARRHRLMSSIYWNLIRRFVFHDFPSLGFDFCLLDRQVVEDVNHINEKNSSIFVLVYWLGYRPVRVPIIRRVREKGTSQWCLTKKIGFTVDTLFGFTYLPARFITAMGFITAGLCMLYLVNILVVWLRLRAAPPGWMTVVGLVSLLGALLLVSLGIVTEYLLRILDEARKRPPYVVDLVVRQKDQTTSCFKDS